MVNNEIDRSDPTCPICRRLKDNHTPEEALNCFNKIRKRQEGIIE